jgi:hypothetical protein
MAKRGALTEAEWLAATSPEPLLDYLQYRLITRKRGGPRRLQMFRCACCRSIWDLLQNKLIREAVEVSERYADGAARRAELELARSAAEAVGIAAANQVAEVSQQHPEGSAAWREARVHSAAASAVTGTMWTQYVVQATRAVTQAARLARSARAAAGLVGEDAARQEAAAWRAEAAVQAALIRCIFGNLPRPVSFDPAWRTPTAVALARAIYHERAFDRLPILADALEEVGCPIQQVLNHCRQPGEHARGCWVVELVLGKD